MGIALHVNHAELNIGIWEKAAGDREETREVVLNDKQDPPQAALSEVAKDELPIFEVFATEPVVQLRTRLVPSRRRPTAR